MKTRIAPGVAVFFGLLLWGCSLVSGTAATQETQAHIKSVRLDGSNVVVTARVPDGLRKITLESRLRLGSSTWQPRAVIRLPGTGGDVVFTLPRSESLEILRVRGDASEPLPAAFYDGSSAFGSQPANSGTWNTLLDAERGGPTAAPGGSREVVESDLWQLRGDTLYVFNQYRGLQVVDVSKPDRAVLRSVFPLAAAGDQMYLLGDRHALLLARNGCGGSTDGPESQVLVLQVDVDPPAVVARLPLAGRITESRLVGTALYLACETYRTLPTGAWEWGVQVSAFDLQNPAAPVPRESLWFPGYGLAVTATPEFLFVAIPNSDYNGPSTVRCFDITSPDGHLYDYAALPSYGRVADKFKMNWVGGVLRVVSERQEPGRGIEGMSVRLETFRLPDPRSAGPVAPGKLGEVELIRGERVFATRFDGQRAYVVTYRQIDPLWVVDLADPSQPRIAGELQVPGFSTYIHPLGNRLVSLGIDDTQGRRVAVSLFDVTDPAKPGLLQRVSLGEDWSWSGATQDEKSLTVLPDLGLIVVPYTASDTNGFYGSRLRLIDLDAAGGTLRARGEIRHAAEIQRSVTHGERLLALAPTDLLSVDPANRDLPVIRQALPLAWSVDRLVLHNDWLIELSSAAYGAGEPAIHVATASEPNRDQWVARLPKPWPIAAASVKDGRLYLAQTDPGTTPPPPESPGRPNLHLSIFDLAPLPASLPLLGEVSARIESLGWWNAFEPLWVKPGLLVLAGGDTSYFGWGYWDGPVLGMPRWGPWVSSSEAGARRLLAFSVDDPAHPELHSDIDLGNDTRISFSPAHVAGPLVYVSHAILEPPGTVLIDDLTKGEPVPVTPPDWFRTWHHQLNVVDYTDSRDPAVRRPVDIPGRLLGLDRGGELLFTLGTEWGVGWDWSSTSGERVDALAYDGVAAHRVASLRLARNWPRPVRLSQGILWLGQPAPTPETKPALEAWALDSTATFALLGRLPVAEPMEALDTFGTLLVAQTGYAVSLLDIAVPASPRLLKTARPDGCFWPNLSTAVGVADRGVWFANGLYGVYRVPLP